MKLHPTIPLSEVLRLNLIKHQKKLGGAEHEFATKIGVSRQMWSLLRLGRCTTRLSEVDRYAKALGVTPAELLTHES